MDIDAFVKIGAFIVAIFALPKLWRETQGLTLSHRRGAFDLAREFISAVQKNEHPLLIELGYKSLFKDAQLTSPEIVYLLGLPRPSRALHLYRKGRQFLEFVDGVADGSPSVGFSEKCLTNSKRKFYKTSYLAFYVIFFSVAAAPVVFTKDLFPQFDPVLFAISGFSFVASISIAFISLNQSMNIVAAERFIELQSGTV